MLAFSTDLFADLNQFGLSSLPDSFVEFNNEVYFVANDGVSGSELWKSDGTEAGTIQLKDINPGADASLPSQLTPLGSDLFFTAVDGDDEVDLWKTDGTAAGTVRVFDADAAGVYELDKLTASGSNLFFTAYQPATGYELWVSDGTAAGTAITLDINSDQSVAEGPRELTDVNGKLFFSSYSNGYDNRELWESDGTVAGTVMVADIDGDPLESSYPRSLTNVNGTLFFTAEDVATGEELYSSTGSTGSTSLVNDLVAGGGSSYPDSLTAFGGELFFAANDGSGKQLFKSDGSSITLVANTTPGATGASNPTELTVVGSDLYFVAEGGVVPGPVVASEPLLTSSNSFRSNSSNYAGIVINTTSLNAGQLRTATSSPLTYGSTTGGDGAIGALGVGLSNIAVGDFILRDVDLGDLATDEWDWTISDAAGLTNIEFSGFASANSFADTFSTAPEGLLFELFLNGSASPSSSIELTGADLDDFNAGRAPDNLNLTHPGGASITSATIRMTFGTSAGGLVVPDAGDEQIVIRAALSATGATSGTAGREIHKTDGTTTSLVKDIVQSTASSEPSELTAVGSELFFSALDPVGSGRELWSSDGTESGTSLVKDIRTGFDSYGAPLSGDPQDLTAVGTQLYFSATNSLNDREVWSSDGSTSGTEQLKNINTGSQDANIQQLVTVGSKLFFVADDGINGEAVWVADPVLGTAVIAADVTASASDKISGLTAFGSGVIFHNDSLGVYTTDGTTTTAITSDQPVDFDGKGSLFATAGSLAYFVFDNGINGEELWKTDGTATGTTMVNDLVLGATGSAPRFLVGLGNLLYFSADFEDQFGNGAMTGRELIVTDGTALSTQVVRDINGDPDPNDPFGPISLSSDPQDLTVSGSRIYFTADSGVNNGNTGRELWSSDGTFAGTTLAGDIRAGATGSDPIDLTDVNGVLYFAANDGSTGYEPYRSDGGSVTSLGNINPGNANSDPSGFMQAGNTVYFSARQTSTGRELWSSDVTTGGVTLVSDLQTGVGSSDPTPLGVVSGDRLLIAMTESGVDRELWMIGGAVAALTQVVDMNPGEFFGSNAGQFQEVGSAMLFVGDDGLAGRELYQLEEFAPEVEPAMVIIDDNTTQRSRIDSFSITFNTIVEITGDAFAFENKSDGEAVVDIPVISELNGKTVVDFTFAAGNSVNAAGILRNGEYELTVDASRINSLGMSLDGDGDGTTGDNYVFDETDGFYRKFGDYNGNNIVDFLDFIEFRRTFNLPIDDPNYNEAYDDNGDGNVGFSPDFIEFRRGYNQ
ncbi:MAG: ELWxxDGT repeat protein [Rubripirellula sp.]